MRILYWARGGFAEEELLAALVGLPVHLTPVRTVDEFVEGLGGADMILLPDSPPDDAPRVAQAIRASHVRHIQFLSAGRDRLAAAGLPDGTEVFGPGDSFGNAVAEHAIALALALYRGLPQAAVSAAERDWQKVRAAPRRGASGDTALVLGLGAIGKRVADKARGMGMEVVAATRRPAPHPACTEVVPLEDLPGLLPKAGCVFLAIALAPETRHILSAATIARMRPGAFVVNVGRGGLIDQPALLAALNSGHLGGAGLDVTDPEPLPQDDPLWSAPGLLLTPHVAASGSQEAKDTLAATVAANVASVLASRN